jgi:hypothetical protein
VTYSSLIWLFPEKNVGIYAVISGPQNKHRGLSMKAMVSMAADLLLGETPWLNTTTACSLPAPWGPPFVSTPPPPDSSAPSRPSRASRPYWNISRPVDDYIGIYGHPGFGNITVFTGDEDDDEEDEDDVGLQLAFGRFGHMRLVPVSESDTDFHGYYIGPLWFVTHSDDSFQPVQLNFAFSVLGKIDSVYFPVDAASQLTQFTRDFHLTGGAKSDASASSACGHVPSSSSYSCSSDVTRLTCHVVLILYLGNVLCRTQL